MNQLDLFLLAGLTIAFLAFVREAVLRERAESRLIAEVVASHKFAAKFVQDERERAELLFASKSVGEYLQARKFSLLPSHIEKPRTRVPLSDADMATLEKNGAFATGGAAVQVGD